MRYRDRGQFHRVFTVRKDAFVLFLDISDGRYLPEKERVSVAAAIDCNLCDVMHTSSGLSRRRGGRGEGWFSLKKDIGPTCRLMLSFSE